MLPHHLELPTRDQDAPVSRGSHRSQAKTIAGVSIGSAVLEKFLGAKSTTLSDAVSGDTATTNAVITFAAYVTSCVEITSHRWRGG